MPSEKGPNKNDENIVKSLSIEEFKKLTEGDTIWVISNPAGNPDLSFSITAMKIHQFYNGDSVKLMTPRLKFPLDFFIADFLNKYKVFTSEQDAQKEQVRMASLN